MTFSLINLFTDTLLVFYKNKFVGLFVEGRVTPLKEKRKFGKNSVPIKLFSTKNMKDFVVALFWLKCGKFFFYIF